MSKSGIVSVRMVITEEKILSNIDKVKKLINPNSKKQIVQLEDDTYFKDLVESIKTYLIEYPKKKNFPISVYKAAYGLVEYATNQFEENTKKIEELIRQREQNIALAGELRELLEKAQEKDKDWKEQLKKSEQNFSEDIVETITIIGKSKDETSEDYQDAMKLLNARINNLESNLHIEIDMERIEDRSKALSYIGIEVADALKSIPTPVENYVEEQPAVQEVVEETQEVVTNATTTTQADVKQEQNIQNVQQVETAEEQQAKQEYIEQTTFEKKPSLWQRIKNSKVVRAIRYISKIRIVVQYPEALPEGRGDNS